MISIACSSSATATLVRRGLPSSPRKPQSRSANGILRRRRGLASAKKETPPPPENGSWSSSSVSLVIPKSVAIGSLAGLCGSLAGMGGGFVMIPLMTSRQWLGLSQHQAHGTSLFAVAATGIAGAWGYEGQVRWDAAAAVALCGSFTAGLGASLTSKLSAIALQRALGIFMIAVAALVPAKGYLLPSAHEHDHEHNSTDESSNDDKQHRDNSHSDPTLWTVRQLLPPACIGLGSGFMAGLFGVGGGAVVVPALTLCSDVTHYQALGTSLCAMAVPAVSGTLKHFQQGNVAMRVAPALAVGAFMGSFLGGRYVGLQTDENLLRWGFSGLMVVLGVRTLRKG